MLPIFRRQCSGVLINVGSLVSSIPQPYATAYVMSKHAANYTGRMVKPMPPVYTAERVAETITGLVEQPRREVFVGNAARMMSAQYTLAPGATEPQLAVMVDRLHLHDEIPAPPSSGNLFKPMMEGSGISGGWGGESGERTRRLATTAGMAALGMLAWRWMRQRGESGQGFSEDGRFDREIRRPDYDVQDRREQTRFEYSIPPEPVRGP